MKKSVVLILHLSFWVLIGLLLLAIFGPMYHHFEHSIGISQMFFISQNVTLAVLIFYIFYFSVPFFIKRKKRLYFLIASIFILALLYGFIAKYINNNSLYLLDTIGVFTPPVILVFIAFIFRSTIELWKGKLLKSEVEKDKLFTQLELLKAKIEPHFLFNSLNNIDVLIEEEPAKASEYLAKLSNILRYVLYETKENKILLAKEIEQIKNYIELQRIRTNNTHFANLSIKGKLNNQEIAPMIFISFVENAFKHCKDKSIMNAINIEFDIYSKSIRMTCKNYYDSKYSETQKNNGLGIEIIKERLNLLYPKNHELVIDKSEQWFNVTLIIKFKNEY